MIIVTQEARIGELRFGRLAANRTISKTAGELDFARSAGRLYGRLSRGAVPSHNRLDAGATLQSPCLERLRTLYGSGCL